MSKKVIYKFIILPAFLFFLGFFLFNLVSVQAQLSVQNSPTTTDSFLLSWSADSYVPADYAGKALPTRGGYVKVVAVPSKMLPMNPDSYYYRWFLDGNVIGPAGGQGKETFSFQVTKWPGNSYDIEVQVLEADETLVSTKTVTIDVAEPLLLLRQDSNDYSLADSFQTPTGQDIKINAFPLFFNIKKVSDLDWQWLFDGQAVNLDSQKDQSQLDLQIPSGKLSEMLQKDLLVSVTSQNDPSLSVKSDLTIEIY